MSNDNEFRVQYKNSVGVWCNAAGAYSYYADACAKLIEEAKNDPEYSHRIVRTQVLGYIAGGLDFDE